MLQDNYTQELLGIKGIIINKIEQSPDEIHIYIQMDRKDHNCTRCNCPTNKVHDYRLQGIKEVSIMNKKTFIHLRKRRYICNCGKKFYESVSFLPRYHRMTSRLVQYIINELKKTTSLTDVAQRANVSVPTVCRVFNYIHYSNNKLPFVLSIDEFKCNTDEGKYQCIITDPEGKKVIDILKSREYRVVSEYFRSYKDRDKVKYFVMDMWKPYKELAETHFKNATIVIDKFHFIRQVLWAFDKVRKEEQKKFAAERRLYFKRSKKLLIKRFNYLSEEDKDSIEIMLQASTKLRNSYLLKEKFFEFVDSNDEFEARKNLTAWYLYVETCNIPEFESCYKAIRNWEKYILNSFKCNYTNGFTEGVNNKIKVLKRNAYGVRNFNRFRNRILHIMA